MIQNNSKGQLTAQVNLGDNVRSGFRFDYPFRGTGRLGRIYNTRMQRVYPSDNVTSNSIAAIQFEPLAVPILANMYLHQEHFYVPENTLWDDFDKFISGGVKMDYQGKKPSMSLQNMWRHFIEFLTNQQEDSLFSFGLYKANRHDFYIKRQSIEFLQGYTIPFAGIVDKYQMYDLFEYINDVMQNLGNYLSTIADENGDVLLFTHGYGLAPENVNTDDFTLYYNEMQPNKYLRKIQSSVKVAFDMKYNGEGMEYIIPTGEGMQFLNALYEVFKPFFGYSSYLDNMGYNKLRFEDFVYCFMCSFTDETTNPDMQDDITLDMDSYIYSLSLFMSTYPQDILPLRAQYSVWWNNYRDQLLEVDAPEPVTSTSISSREVVTLLAPRVRCWHKDTFTTALDNPGTGSVGVPVGANYFDDGGSNSYKIYTQTAINRSNEPLPDGNNIYQIEYDNKVYKLPTSFLSGISQQEEIDIYDDVKGFSLYQLDAARRAQKWLQRALFFGNRIQDFLYTHFGVKYLDARLRLPELLSTSKQLVRLTDVINNTNIKSEDGTVAIAGDRAAIAHAYDENGGAFKRYIEEHGYIVSNLTVMPDVTYANGFNRDLAMLDQFDYPFPEFATLGMDAVYDIEMAQIPIMVQTEIGNMNLTDNPSVFGYQGRYYTVKSKLGEEHGELLDTQDMYTFARDFNVYDPDKRPKLNYVFVHCHPVLDMFVVDNAMSDYFRFDIYFNSGADRPFPAHSVII